jgi:2-iminobutanoate/2-iminopropanoate deaminase
MVTSPYMTELRRQVSTTEAPPPTAGAYSQGIVSGDFLFLAGQCPFDLEGRRIQGTFEEEARLAFSNLAAVARAGGGDLRNAVRVGVYLLDMDNFATMNEIFGEFFPDSPPARTTLQANLRGFQIEVDAIVRLDREQPSGA